MSIPFVNALEAPRLTTAERGGLIMPGTGSLIYNTIDKMLQINVGTPEVPDWQPVGIGTSEIVTEGLVPTSPYPGQKMIYMDNATNPTYRWHMMYNPDHAGPNKWECIGGDPWIANTLNGKYDVAGNTWSQMLPLASNALTIFRPGQYLIECGYGFSFQGTVSYYDFNAQYSRVSPGGAGLAPGTFFCEAGIPGSGDNSSVTVEIDHTGGSSVSGAANLVAGALALYEWRTWGAYPAQQAWIKVIPKCFS